MADETVLVTGGSGFVGTHCIVQLLAAGYRVRTTVRSLTREAEVRAAAAAGAATPDDALSFVVADLGADAEWHAAVAGCTYVLHVASPFPLAPPKHDDDLIVPARDGTLRVLRAARDAGVRRVVITSSFAAIGYGHPPRARAFDETDWTNAADAHVSAYAKSKTIAERAAWDFVAHEGRGLELAVVNPVGIFGPTLGRDLSASLEIMRRLMNGGVPGCPHIAFGAVDVRDVADLHLRAMIDPRAKGQRFLAVAGDFLWFIDVARILRRRLGADAARVPTREIPDFVVRMLALVDPGVRGILPEIDKEKNATAAKARDLGWMPRSAEDAIVASAESLLAHNLLNPAKRARIARV